MRVAGLACKQPCLQLLAGGHSPACCACQIVFAACGLYEHGATEHTSYVHVSACCAVMHAQVLNLAGNRLRTIPSDVGWLALKQLNISNNLDLNIPAHVLQCGFK